MQEHLENLFNHHTEEGFNNYFDEKVMPAIAEGDWKYTVTKKFAFEQLSRGNKRLVFKLGENLYKGNRINRSVMLNAQLHMEIEEYSKALKWLNRLDPNKISYESLLLKLKCFVQLNLFKEAETLGTHMLTLTRKGFEVDYLLGQAYYELGQYEISYKKYLNVWKINKKIWPEILLKFAPLKIWDLDNIVDCIKETIVLNVEELYSLASYYYYRNKPEYCHQTLTRALKKEPNNIDCLLMHLKILSILGLEQCFHITFDKLLKINNIGVWFLEAAEVLYRSDITYDDIKSLVYKFYYEVIETPRVIEALEWLVNFAMKDDEENDALIFLNEILDHTIDKDYLSHIYGALYERLDMDQDLVIGTYAKGLELGVNDPEILYNLVSYCFRNQKVEMALKMMEKYELTIYWNSKLQIIKDQYYFVLNEK